MPGKGYVQYVGRGEVMQCFYVSARSSAPGARPVARGHGPSATAPILSLLDIDSRVNVTIKLIKIIIMHKYPE